MRILVLGGSGFVGGHFRALARHRGDPVWATHGPGETPPDADVPWLPLDLLDGDSIRAALRESRPEGVLHLAGQADVARANRDPAGTFRINAEGTLRVLDAVRHEAPGARVVVITSAEVYGAVPADELPVREDRMPAPLTPYGVSKACADLVAERAAAAWNLAVVRVRPFNHVGPGQRLGFVAPDFAAQVAAIERGRLEPVLKVGNLSGRRDFTDVRDVVRGYRAALERGVPGRVYNLCSGTSLAIETIVRFFVDRAAVPIEIRTDPSRVRPVEVAEFRGDASRAHRDLDWRPEVPIDRSLADVLAEWRAAPDAALPGAPGSAGGAD